MSDDEPKHEPQPEPDDGVVEPDPPPGRSGRRRALTALAVLFALVAAGLTGGALFLNSVDLGGLGTLPASTTVLYSDGTPMARLGDQNRTVLEFEEISDEVKQAAVAADDPDFWTGDVTPIPRSVVRQAFELRGAEIPDKVRVSVLAWKLDDAYSKEEILAYYLNAMPFGRRAYGVEAAAREYFGKTVNTHADAATRLTVAEAIVLVAMIRQPEPDAANPDSPGYDPGRGPKALANSKARWDEIRSAMLRLGHLTASQADALSYPTTVKPYDPKPGPPGTDRPTGLVVNHVLSELSRAEGQFKGRPWSQIRNGGYAITTTLHQQAQALLEKAADETVGGSVMSGQPANLQAAAVVVEPGTGRVIAYFGGHDGTGGDYAGFFYDEKGEAVGYGAHRPGGTFHVHVLAAALKSGISVRSMWNATSPQDLPGRMGAKAIRNTGRCPTGGSACSLADSTLVGLETTFYAVTATTTPAKVLEMARDAGVDYMWADDRTRQELYGAKDMGEMTPRRFDVVLGLGQYPVTVVDQANAMATYAAAGLRARAHFVQAVRRGSTVVYSEALPRPDQPRLFNPAVSADLTWTLSRTEAGKLTGRDSASKTGTWQFFDRLDQNEDAWIVGYTGNLAMAVWVGNKRDQQALKDSTGATVWGSGLPAGIYRGFMNPAHEAMRLPPVAFPPPAFVGQERPPLSVPG